MSSPKWKTPLRTHRSIAAVAVKRSAALIACTLISGCDRPEPLGPVPPGGYDYAPIDYNRPRFPAATNVDVPPFHVDDTAKLPFLVMPPPVKVDLPLSFSGEIHHPNAEVQATFVRVAFFPLAEPGDKDPTRAGGMRGYAKGEDGYLKYRLEGRVPKSPGRYSIKLEVRHLITDPDVRSLPEEQRMTTTLVGEGELTVTK